MKYNIPKNELDLDEMKVVYNPDLDCKLLSKMIEHGPCYDIQFISNSSSMDDEQLKDFLMLKTIPVNMLEKRKELCPTCKFNALPPMTEEERREAIVERNALTK